MECAASCAELDAPEMAELRPERLAAESRRVRVRMWQARCWACVSEQLAELEGAEQPAREEIQAAWGAACGPAAAQCAWFASAAASQLAAQQGVMERERAGRQQRDLEERSHRAMLHRLCCVSDAAAHSAAWAKELGAREQAEREALGTAQRRTRARLRREAHGGVLLRVVCARIAAREQAARGPLAAKLLAAHAEVVRDLTWQFGISRPGATVTSTEQAGRCAKEHSESQTRELLAAALWSGAGRLAAAQLRAALLSEETWRARRTQRELDSRRIIASTAAAVLGKGAVAAAGPPTPPPSPPPGHEEAVRAQEAAAAAGACLIIAQREEREEVEDEEECARILLLTDAWAAEPLWRPDFVIRA
eukprot:TRINITY_DN47583_c0_g1_i1.p3 TRINITY_DN47583_c0_g1~~TRINITY_DN47583_c0_g1_i1.p3  ORF type:complete len:389 (+),score=152.76 TRINITY_DN47583_c0_g1_i1:78-1169(+)